jgi:hypothetical protein
MISAKSRILWGCLTAIFFGANPAFADFEWGSPCDDGNGEFEQYVVQGGIVEIGKIPAGMGDINVRLFSPSDVDIQLIDVATGEAIVAWPYGLLNQRSEECATYEGLEYCYSGFNGVDGERGNEWIQLNGVSNRELMMTAYGYDAGYAQVYYSWSASDDCVDQGSGEFSQPVDRYRTRVVGTIPAGKTNVSVSLESDSGADIDIQLFAGREKIIAWDLYGEHGLLSGPTQETISDWNGLRITYSGYNGRNNNPGLEDITISGTLPVNLTVKVFGYEAGFATVNYSWGNGAIGDTCGGRTQIPAHPCLEGLKCYAANDGLAVDQPGLCVEENYCASSDTINNDCVPLSLGSSPSDWVCQDNACVSLSSPGSALEGEVCGGLAAIACGTDLFCDFGATCGFGDQSGVCSQMTQLCPKIFNPVCGCDGMTYSNACMAAGAGVSVSTEGACPGQ